MKRLSRRKRAEADGDSPAWKTWQACLFPVQADPQLLPVAAQCTTVTQPRALEKQTCIFSTPT